ncbi:L,D-transpeptidase family protein [Sphingomonas elodea]|uniref:L,D-transpeptidase family protein n=1 Tax=Sphingomonas elodea TaxID=179878 RepID=UPI0002630913|nr:L,D-transpeptidase family protein [Sphingomonas elodea]
MAGRRPIGMWVSIAATLTLAGVVGAPLLMNRAPRAEPRPFAVVPSPTPKDRIRFPNDQPQQLQMGDGSTRVVHSLLQPPERMRFGDYLWNERDVPPGPIWMRVDLSRQIISVFRGEDEIGTSVILYGQDATPTPIGNFPVRGVARNHRSNNYDAEMPYTLWLTKDGVAIHGSDVRQGLATHGCIGVPLAFAQRLFAVVRTGDLVTVVR